MKLWLELINKLELFGVVVLRMCDIVELSLKFLDLLVFILKDCFVGILSFDVSFFLFHDMRSKSMKFLLSDFDFLVDDLIGGLELFIIFLIEELYFM